jgi:hypothetical protein
MRVITLIVGFIKQAGVFEQLWYVVPCTYMIGLTHQPAWLLPFAKRFKNVQLTLQVLV